MSSQPVSIYIDGGSRGNPGPSAFAFVIQTPDGPPIEQHGRLPDTTNNIAEYTALVKALEKAADLNLSRLAIHSDSELLVKQMNGEYRVKNPDIKLLYDEAKTLVDRFASVTLTHIRREFNKRADQLCNINLDEGKTKAPAAPSVAVNADGVRDDALACLSAARSAWAARDPRAPTEEQLWEQLWSILEEGGVLKKPKGARKK
jgi:ribonuclease HI